MSDLIDTTEMYLKTIYELEEVGIVALRARIAERLHQSGPTVSQTVARMERAGLLTVEGDRHLELSPLGQSRAMRVMRKHRLAERLLVDVIGLDWVDAHEEACRWEHVMSEAVERRLLDVLDHPTESPYGTPIPGLDELGAHAVSEDFRSGVVALDRVDLSGGGSAVQVRRISEPAQKQPETMAELRRVGAVPGATVHARRIDGGFRLGADGQTTELDRTTASHIFVDAADAG